MHAQTLEVCGGGSFSLPARIGEAAEQKQGKFGKCGWSVFQIPKARASCWMMGQGRPASQWNIYFLRPAWTCVLEKGKCCLTSLEWWVHDNAIQTRGMSIFEKWARCWCSRSRSLGRSEIEQILWVFRTPIGWTYEFCGFNSNESEFQFNCFWLNPIVLDPNTLH